MEPNLGLAVIMVVTFLATIGVIIWLLWAVGFHFIWEKFFTFLEFQPILIVAFIILIIVAFLISWWGWILLAIYTVIIMVIANVKDFKKEKNPPNVLKKDERWETDHSKGYPIRRKVKI